MRPQGRVSEIYVIVIPVRGTVAAAAISDYSG
jgi:hypothetical protein